MTSSFAEAVRHGLTATPKHLSSKYFYDTRGDLLFQRIMELPEYYLTRKEYEILNNHKDQFAEAFSDPQGFDLVELGAGDGHKMKLLLHRFCELNLNFAYHPIDISAGILQQLSNSLSKELPGLQVHPHQGEYLNSLEDLKLSRKKVIVLLGSNLGNFLPDEASIFLGQLAAGMHPQDVLLIGIDQKKDPRLVYEAYNDRSGVTAAFNMNLLARINRELGGNFVLADFLHWPLYDPQSGMMISYLVSRKAQQVQIDALDLQVCFKPWESIRMEYAVKYDPEEFEALAQAAGLRSGTFFCDSQDHFRNYLLQKK